MENILEYLIPLIFIISFFSMRKKKKKAMAEKQGSDQSQEKKAVSGGVFGKLNKLMTEYYEADLKGAPAKKAEGTWAEDPSDLQQPLREPEPWEEDEDVQESVQAHVPIQKPIVEPEPVIEKAEPEPERRPAIKPKVKVVKPEPPERERSCQTTASYKLADMRKRDLRQAIVWAEILAPPKALRDN